MILTENTLNVKDSGFETQKFGIALSRKMFSVLSKGIYSDPIKAIVRELGTNAYDSHVMANKTNVPFRVHLPNYNESFFEISDDGVGLSKEQIYNLYTQYGLSNKTNSNLTVGALGFGSKSPFAYTDSFSITSRFNGTKSIYTAFLDKDGFPVISEPLSETPTTESNGLEIKFAVKTNDFGIFAQKAQEIFYWFKVRPIVVGNSSYIVQPKPTYLKQTDSYGIYKTKSYGVQSYVSMGNIAYPINKDLVAPYYGNYGNNPKIQGLTNEEVKRVRSMLDWGVELYANIGEVDFTASREQLSYTQEDGLDGKKTIDYIRNTCLKAIKELEAEVTKDIASKPNIWEAKKEFYRIQSSWHDFKFEAKWNGQPITMEIIVPSNTEVEQIYRYNSYGNTRTKKTKPYQIIPEDNMDVIINDGRGSYSSVILYVENNPTKKILYLPDEKTDEKWLVDSGINEVLIKASTLPKPVKKTVVRGKADKAKLYKLKDITNGYNPVISYWEGIEIDLSDVKEYVYVWISFFNYKNKKDEETKHPKELVKMLKEIQVHYPDTIIYGVKPSDEGIIKKSKGTFITFENYFALKMNDLDKKFKDDTEKYFDYVNAGYTKEYIKYFSKVKVNNEFDALVKSLDESEKVYKKAVDKNNTSMSSYIQLYGRKHAAGTSKLLTKFEDLKKKYKLLNHCNVDSSSIDNIVEYIKMVDKN